MNEHHLRSLANRLGKGPGRSERLAGTGAEELADVLTAALTDARLAVGALAASLGLQQPEKTLASGGDET